MPSITLTKDQTSALENIIAWQKKPHKQFLTLGGYAGTGKTTLLSIFRSKLFSMYPKLKVGFCAFTGKASQVLQKSLKQERAVFKGDKVGTIHSLIYQAITDNKGVICGWEKRTSLPFDLLIVDEASMVSEVIWKDLLSFAVPIIAVGDHGQLTPIEDKFSLMKQPDITLEKIHRQAEGSPIIKLSQVVREVGYIPVGRIASTVVKHSRVDSDIHSITQSLLESWDEESLFLVGMNATRIQLNQQVRSLRDYYSLDPATGDRVICLKNNWQVGIYNGMLGTILHLESDFDRAKTHQWFKATIQMDDGSVYSGKISRHQFNSAASVREVKGLKYAEIGDLFDFGYALTVHKAQGSQARRVIVFEQRNKYMSDEEWRRWLYTAVTRAEEELIIIGD